MEDKSKKKGLFKILSGVVVGGAIGSILGLTLAPKKGSETRKKIKDKSMELFLKGKKTMKNEEKKKVGFFKKLAIKALKPKRKK